MDSDDELSEVPISDMTKTLSQEWKNVMVSLPAAAAATQLKMFTRQSQVKAASTSSAACRSDSAEGAPLAGFHRVTDAALRRG